MNTIHVAEIAAQTSRRAESACVAALNDVVAISTPKTPLKDGQLRAQRRVTPIAGGARAIWSAIYAGAQNAGVTRGHPIRRYTTPGTGKQFVEYGLNQVLPRFVRYIK